MTISDARGLRRDVPVRVAYYAGSAPPNRLRFRSPGDPASADFVRAASGAPSVIRATQVRPGAQVVVGPDDVPIRNDLAQDRVAVADVPVLIQGNAYFEVDATHPGRRAQRRRASDFSGLADGQRLSRTPGGERLAVYRRPSQRTAVALSILSLQPARAARPAIVLRADNHSSQPAIVQFISGRGGPIAQRDGGRARRHQASS